MAEENRERRREWRLTRHSVDLCLAGDDGLRAGRTRLGFRCRREEQ
jgi:hypothetical protein